MAADRRTFDNERLEPDLGRDVRADGGDTLTVLRSADSSPKLTAKRHIWDEGKQGATAALKTVSYPKGAYEFTVEPVRLACFADLAGHLNRLALDPYCIVIRGALIDGRNPASPMRRLRKDHKDRKTGETTPANFEPCAPQWIALDVDKLPNPEGHNPAIDPDAALEYALEHVPPAFREASCWAQWTASQNIDVLDGQGRPPKFLNCRLWFWLSRPVSDAEAAAWLCGERGDGSREWPSIDESLYRVVSAHYTAAPIWEGRPDPLPHRFMVREGEGESVDVPHIEIRSPASRRRPGEGDGAPLDILEDGETLTAANKAATIRRLADAWPTDERHWFSLAIAGGILRQGVSVREAREIVYQAAICAHDEDADGRAINVETTADALAAGISATGWTRAFELAGDRDALARARRACTTKRTVRPPMPKMAPTWPADGLVSLKEGEHQTAEAVGAWWRAMEAHNGWTIEPTGEGPSVAPVHAVAVTMGGGKSYQAIEAAAALPTGETLYYAVPDHALGRELEGRFLARGIPARTVRGLGQLTDDGRPMCAQFDNAMRPWIAAGQRASDLCKYCPLRFECPTEDQRQRKAEPGVVIGPYAYLAMGEDQRPFPSPGAVVIDESFLDALTHGLDAAIVVEVADLASPPSDFGAGVRPKKGLGLETAKDSRTADVRETMIRVAKAIQAGEFTPAGLRKHGLDADRCREAQNAWYGRKIDIDAAALHDFEAETVETLIANASGDPRALRMARLFKLLEFYLSDDYPDDGGMLAFELLAMTDKETRTETPCIRMVWGEAPKLDCPVLLLDGTLNEEIARQFFPDLSAVTSIRIAAPHARVVQVVEGGVSMNRLGAVDGLSSKDQKSASNRRRRIMELAETAAAQSLPDEYGTRAVLATFKRTRGDIERDWADRIEAEASDMVRGQWTRLAGGIDLAHGGHIRGVDRWKDVGAIVVACRPLPRPDALERRARAIYWRDPNPIDALAPDGRLPTELRSIRLSDGNGVGVRALTHPDPRCAAALDQICRAEVEQIVHRLRIVRRTAENPATVYLLTETPIDVTVDAVRTFDGVVPDPVELMLARGVLPEGWPITQAILADRFGTVNAAKIWFRDNPDISRRRADILERSKACGFPIITSNGKITRFSRYRVKPVAGNAQIAWLDVTRHPDPLAAFQFWLGSEGVVSVEPAPLAEAAQAHADDSENAPAEQYAPAREIDDVTALLTSTRAREKDALADLRSSTPAREISDAEHFRTAPTRASDLPVDDFDAEAFDVFGDDNVKPLFGKGVAANDAIADPPGQPLRNIARPAEIAPKGMVMKAIPSTATTAKTWPETVAIERDADLLAEPPLKLATAPALHYARHGGDMPDDMRPALDLLRINRGWTWDRLADDMDSFDGPSREHLSNARTGTFALSPRAARGVVAWMFDALDLPEPDPLDPETLSATEGALTHGKRPGLPARPPSGEGRPTTEARGNSIA